MNNQDIYQQKESEDREQFLTMFKYQIKAFELQSTECYYDIKITGRTDIVSEVEIKQRNKTVQQLSASTFIEVTKLKHFKAQNFVKRNDNKYQLLYVVFCSNGFIIYNLSERYKANSSDVLYSYCRELPKKTIEDLGNINKYISELHFNNDYHDMYKLY